MALHLVSLDFEWGGTVVIRKNGGYTTNAVNHDYIYNMEIDKSGTLPWTFGTSKTWSYNGFYIWKLKMDCAQYAGVIISTYNTFPCYSNNDATMKEISNVSSSHMWVRGMSPYLTNDGDTVHLVYRASNLCYVEFSFSSGTHKKVNILFHTVTPTLLYETIFLADKTSSLGSIVNAYKSYSAGYYEDSSIIQSTTAVSPLAVTTAVILPSSIDQETCIDDSSASSNDNNSAISPLVEELDDFNDCTNCDSMEFEDCTITWSSSQIKSWTINLDADLLEETWCNDATIQPLAASTVTPPSGPTTIDTTWGCSDLTEIPFIRPVITSPICDDDNEPIWTYKMLSVPPIESAFGISIDNVNDKIVYRTLDSSSNIATIYTITITAFLFTESHGGFTILVNIEPGTN